MTPAARVQAAIEVLDRVLAGEAAEKALTGWARASRFAGSKDRAAVRDHVFDALRSMRSFAARGGGQTGRGLMLGALRAGGAALETLFTGTGYAPAPLNDTELSAGRDPAPGPEALDLPDWLWPLWQESLGDAAALCARALQHRAPVHLRVNAARMDRETARVRLADEGIATEPHAAAPHALTVLEGARRIRQSAAFAEGLVELQDAASQAVVAALPLREGMRVLDYCAGGGGKALAMAARTRLELVCHDADPRRMRDLPARAARADIAVDLGPPQGLFDLVLADAPCSGSGAWRRAPEGKWLLTPEGLGRLTRLQDEVLDQAARRAGPEGVLAYATCSVLRAENEDRVDAFTRRHPGWSVIEQRRWPIDAAHDGFFLALLTRTTRG